MGGAGSVLRGGQRSSSSSSSSSSSGGAEAKAGEEARSSCCSGGEHRARSHTYDAAEEKGRETRKKLEPLTPQPKKKRTMGNKSLSGNWSKAGEEASSPKAAAPPEEQPCAEEDPVGRLVKPEPTTPKVARRPNVQWTSETEGETERRTEGEAAENSSRIPERVVRMISAALTDMFFLGTAMFAEMTQVTTSFSEERFDEKEVVVREGDAGDRMFVVASGSVKFFKKRDGRDVYVGEAREGDVVGELALFYGGKRAATVVAGKGGVQAWSIRREQFRAIAAVDANARSLTLRAVTLRSMPSLSRLSRRQIYTLARAMRLLELEPKATLANEGDQQPPQEENAAADKSSSSSSRGGHSSPSGAACSTKTAQQQQQQKRKFDSLVLVQEGSLRVEGVSARTGAALEAKALHDLLFPRQEMASQLITLDDTGLVCEAGALLGLHLLVARKERGRAERRRSTADEGDGVDDHLAHAVDLRGRSPRRGSLSTAHSSSKGERPPSHSIASSVGDGLRDESSTPGGVDRRLSGTAAAASESADGDCDKIKLRIVAGASGCRVHSVTLSTLCAHLGSNIPQLILGSDYDDDDDAAAAEAHKGDKHHPKKHHHHHHPPGEETPLASSYLTIDEAIAQSPGKPGSLSSSSGSFDKLLLTRGDFSLAKLLGQGSYGYVVRAKLKKQQQHPPASSSSSALARKKILSEFPHGKVALKLMAKARVVAKRQLNHVLDERRLLSRMRHPFVMRLVASFQDERTLYLVTEFIDGPDLWSVVYEPQAVGYLDGKLRDAPDSLLRLYCACIVQALSHIHSHGIVYRDLKPENLLVSPSGYLKIVDFGFAKQLPYYTATSDDSHATNLHAHFKTFTLCGTGEYLAPEMIQCAGHDWATDVWAAACVFHELAVGNTPFIERHGEPDSVIMKRILHSKVQALIPPFRLARRKFLSRLVVDCLKFDPTERLTAEELLSHRAFDGLDWELLVHQAFMPEWAPNRTSHRADDDYDDAKDRALDLELEMPPYNDDQSIFEAFSASLPN